MYPCTVFNESNIVSIQSPFFSNANLLKDKYHEIIFFKNGKKLKLTNYKFIFTENLYVYDFHDLI